MLKLRSLVSTGSSPSNNKFLSCVLLSKFRNSSSEAGHKTALYDFHVKNGGKIVNFGGYELPVQYADLGISASHLHTRQSGSIFDVSHMLQTYVRGKDAASCMESICTADILGAENGKGSLTVFPNEQGGILDDLIVTKVNDKTLYVVSNAAMSAQDQEIMKGAVAKFQANGKDVAIEFLPTTQQSLIAVQGPNAAKALKNLVTQLDLSQMYFMTSTEVEVAGVKCRVTRCGYTGEDGFEISVPSDKIEHVTEALLSQKEPNLKLAGLGARDSLRLEAGLCLYGSDLDNSTTPVEADLQWLVAKRRRAELNFPGAQIIVQQLKEGTQRKRVGLLMTGGKVPPARAHVEIYHQNEKVGEITSGCPSPSISKNIAMGYIDSKLKSAGTKVQLKIRDKFFEAEVAKMPFVSSKYFVKPRK